MFRYYFIIQLKALKVTEVAWIIKSVCKELITQLFNISLMLSKSFISILSLIFFILYKGYIARIAVRSSFNYSLVQANLILKIKVDY